MGVLGRSKIEGRDSAQRSTFGRTADIPANDAESAIKHVHAALGADLAAHIADTTDAHDASAISVVDAGGLYAATQVEAALAEVMTDLNADEAALAAHIADATAAHAASAISYGGGTGMSATDVEAAIDELATEKAGAAVTACFAAHKNGTDQTGLADATFVQVTWSTETFDVGGHFASNTWTPPAGKVLIVANVRMGGTISVGALVAIRINKNGASFKIEANRAIIANDGISRLTLIDTASGTDTYSVDAFIDVSSGTGTVEGDATDTWFMGTMLT